MAEEKDKVQQSFKENMKALGQPVGDDYRQTNEWKLFVAGYNTCARIANDRTLNRNSFESVCNRTFRGGV